MKKYLQIINIRTFQVLLVCSLTSFLAIRYDVQFNTDLTVISIAIVFPLVFTIRAAFRRREKALEHLSRFKSSLMTVRHCFVRNSKLSEEKRTVVLTAIQELSASFHRHLSTHSKNRSGLKDCEDAIINFILANREEIKTSEAYKIFRFMKDVHGSIENTLAIDSHRTPVSLRAYCQIFIYFFPLIYSPALLHRLDHSSNWVVYTLSMVTGFILISLFNVQDQMEHPFDQQGLDDIRMDEFKLHS